jgi:hypothetical protein
MKTPSAALSRAHQRGQSVDFLTLDLYSRGAPPSTRTVATGSDVCSPEKIRRSIGSRLRACTSATRSSFGGLSGNSSGAEKKSSFGLYLCGRGTRARARS